MLRDEHGHGHRPTNSFVRCADNHLEPSVDRDSSTVPAAVERAKFHLLHVHKLQLDQCRVHFRKLRGRERKHHAAGVGRERCGQHRALNIVWVNLPSGLAAAPGPSNSITIYMNIMGSNVMSSTGPTGEAPELSSSFGQYDDGSSVFTFYSNAVSTNGYNYVNGIAGDFNVLTQTGPFGASIPTLQLGGAGSGNGESVAWVNSGVAGNGIVEGWFKIGINTNAYFTFRGASSSTQTNYLMGDGWSGTGSAAVYMNAGSPSVIFGQGSSLITWTWASGNFVGSTLSMNVYNQPYGTLQASGSGTDTNLGGGNTYVGLAVWQGSSGPGYFSFWRVRAYPPNGVMPSCSICVAGVVLPTVTPMVFSPGNSIMQGAFDTVTSTTSGTGDTIAIEDCVGSGTSCTPSTVLATNSVGSNSVTYNLNGMGVGNFIFDACDTTHGVCSATNTVVISNAPYLHVLQQWGHLVQLRIRSFGLLRVFLQWRVLGRRASL